MVGDMHLRLFCLYVACFWASVFWYAAVILAAIELWSANRALNQNTIYAVSIAISFCLQ